MGENKMEFGTGIKVWCVICIVAGFCSVILNLVNGYLTMAIIGCVFPACYAWLLIGKKRFAFFLIVIGAAAIFIINVAINHINIILSLVGFANPLIAFALLSKYWQQMD